MAKSSTKTVGKPAAKAVTENKKTFEEKLERLEKLGEKIRKPDIPLGEALKAFEEGIKIARTLEKELEKIESRIEILMNSPDIAGEGEPELELFRDFE